MRTPTVLRLRDLPDSKSMTRFGKALLAARMSVYCRHRQHQLVCWSSYDAQGTAAAGQG